MSFFCSDPATTEIYTLSLHDALPIYSCRRGSGSAGSRTGGIRPSRAPTTQAPCSTPPRAACGASRCPPAARSEEHTSELQSQSNLVCRLLLEKKNINHHNILPSVYDL